MPTTVEFNTAGTYTLEDDGIRGNGVSVVRNQFGAIYATIVHPADSVSFLVGVPGVHIILNALDSFGSANFTVGSLTDPFSPDSIVVRNLRSDAFVTLVSNGSITEGGIDAPADIIAVGLVLSAATGVGNAANAIETQITFIEAETNTGGINLVNSGSVQIGGLSAEVRGLDVVTSGNINFTNTGFIVLNDTTGSEMVHGGDSSGNVTLTAIGADADIFATINNRLVTAPGGGITLNAGRDLYAGTAGTNFNNDILATTFVNINVGRDFVLDGTANVQTSAFGGVVGGPINIHAGRNIELRNTTGGLQSIDSFLGNLTLTTGPGGAYISDAAFPDALSSTGDITIIADAVLLNAGGINTTGVGTVTIRPVTPGRSIDIGGTVDASTALTLSDAELDRIVTLNLNIGDANSGNVDVTAPVSPNNVFDNILVRSATEIFVNSSITAQGSLTLRAGNDIFFTAAGSFTTTSGSLIASVDQIQDDGGDGGVGDLSGTISVSGTITLAGNSDPDSLRGSAAADTLSGLGGNDLLDGREGSDVLVGGIGNDTLVGGTGAANQLIGGTGDDIYVVSVAGDSLVEAAGEGTDLVRTDLPSFTLRPNTENLTFTGAGSFNGTGTDVANVIIGGSGSDSLSGLGGNDTLSGGTGAANQLIGGTGDDTYVVSAVGDSIVELAGAGNDQISTTLATYVMAANVERMTFIGAGNFTGIGNADNNIIIGAGGDDMLIGNDGTDTLLGFGGNDTLMGGSGAANAVQGGLGNDTYVVSANDTVTEFAGEGTDRVNTDRSSYTLAANVENLFFTGAGAFAAAGNGLANFINGGASADTLNGVAGDDIISGNGGADLLIGGTGADLLNGGLGNDKLDGGADSAADRLVFDSALGATNVDTVLSFEVGIDRFLLDNAVFTGLAAGALPASAFVVGSAAADADDRIIYNSATGALLFDADGSGAGAAVQFATAPTGLPLTAGDFAVI